MDRRIFLKGALGTGGALLSGRLAWAETYLTVDQAKKVLWGEVSMEAVTVELTKEQVRAIQKASKDRVRSNIIKAWKTSEGDWFILDQVIGKHENIDMAVALTREGKVKGLEVLTYRETYGHEIRNPRWRAQFHGKNHEENLRLDHQIKNISGATLSCRHVTDGVNRLTHTWDQVLRHL